MSGGIKAELNKLQQWWNENHVSKGLYDPKDNSKKKSQLLPILYPPFDVIRSGGILVLGYNPGGAGGKINEFIAAVEKSKKEHNGIPPVYDKKKGGWYHVYAYDDIKGGVTTGKTGKYSKRYKKRGPKGEERLSKFNTKQWHGKDKKSAGLSDLGAFNFNAAFNKMLEDMELSNWRGKLMHANFIPFNSVNVKAIPTKHKPEIEKLSAEWVKALIRTSKPSMIVLAGGSTAKAFKKNIGMAKEKGGIIVHAHPSAKQKERIDSGEKVSLEQYYSTGVYNGIPVVQFLHWTGHQKGGPLKATWKNPENVEVISADFKRLLTKGPNTTVEVEAPPPTKKATRKKPSVAKAGVVAKKDPDWSKWLRAQSDDTKNKLRSSKDHEKLTLDQIKAKY